MIKSILVRFVFLASVVFVGIFVSGCGDDLSRYDLSRYDGKEVVILINVKDSFIDTIYQAGRKEGYIVEKFAYKNETCKSIGYSKFINSDSIGEALYTSYKRPYSENECEMFRGSHSSDTSVILVFSKPKTNFSLATSKPKTNSKSYILKNAPLIVILKNVNAKILSVNKKEADKAFKDLGFKRVNEFDYDKESCESLGFDDIVDESKELNMQSKSYINSSGRMCMIADYGNAPIVAGSLSTILIYGK